MQNVTSDKRMINSEEKQQLKLWKQWFKQIIRFQDKSKVIDKPVKRAA